MAPYPLDTETNPSRDKPDDNDNDNDNHHDGIPGWAIFLIIVILVAILASAAWFLWVRLRARRNASSLPAPARGGILGWLRSRLNSAKNRRSAPGAYEPSGYGGRSGHAMDHDEAWDARVGHEADAYGPAGYYEEQELGLHPYRGRTEYEGGGGAPAAGLTVGVDRGRSTSRQRDAEDGYDEGVTRGGVAPLDRDPFSDEAEQSSLRGVSPKPIDTDKAQKSKADGGASTDNSPTERRSMFRENM
ncbi:hypothetical protein P152DRAFT_235188 [Eremomyces bilateralis CBS 781.70]|uniref:Uncharacterized protein n=1 Tax=Eremomyces bilateralis CBS 781.70 TaxID=1392243 RepID=A0A6G1G9U2_9PEZI|nr:uncharacterized protein P152DRAFT_235188 [Eremomyces bilateralis CBS 781.70]KAF1814848.1 hypothetical protein P152DRAFT_235188 [Eremomyces bilateralis CBS 781.70]